MRPNVTPGKSEVLDKQAILKLLLDKAALQTLPAPAAPLVQKVRMFTAADDKVLIDISDTFEKIEIIQRNGRNANAGYKSANEAIMDYGTDRGEYAISPEVRLGIQNLLKDQFARRGIAVPDMASFKVRLPFKNILADIQNFAKNLDWKYMPNGDRLQEADFAGFHAVAAALDVWVDEMQLQFNESERKKIKIALCKMITSYPQDMSNNYLKFVYSLWQMRAMYNYYDNWQDREEKGKFLDAIKAAAYQNFMHVIEQLLNEGGNLKCLTGAKGRTLLVDFSMVRFLRDQHPEFAVNL